MTQTKQVEHTLQDCKHNFLVDGGYGRKRCARCDKIIDNLNDKKGIGPSIYDEKTQTIKTNKNNSSILSRHTPGPWRLNKHGCVVADNTTGHDDLQSIKDYEGHLIGESICILANARLIASAPELLEALKEARASLWEAGHRNISIVLNNCDRAIAKAEGN